MPQIMNKLELDDLLILMTAQYESLFATNSNKELTAEKLREYMGTQISYLTILNDSMKIQRPEFVAMNGAVETITELDSNVLYIHANTEDQIINLPPLTPVNEGVTVKGLLLSDTFNTTFVPDGSDPLAGANPSSDSLYYLTATAKGWILESQGFA